MSNRQLRGRQARFAKRHEWRQDGADDRIDRKES
jgi:hypothetical protein